MPSPPSASSSSSSRGLGSALRDGFNALRARAETWRAPRPRFWIDERACKSCYECDRRFGPTARKHHCRACGRVFCARCSSNALPPDRDPDGAPRARVRRVLRRARGRKRERERAGARGERRKRARRRTTQLAQLAPPPTPPTTTPARRTPPASRRRLARRRRASARRPRPARRSRRRRARRARRRRRRLGARRRIRIRRVLYTGPHTTASARWTPILKDFCRRFSQPTPRFQSRHTSTPFNSN